MLAKNLVHQAVLAGYSARFLKALDLVLDLNADVFGWYGCYQLQIRQELRGMAPAIGRSP